MVSLYTAEMMAIVIALQWVEEVLPDRVVVCSDSNAALCSISSVDGSSRPDLVLKVRQSLYRPHSIGKEVVFCWVPAHASVVGNEVADRLAKQSVRSEQVLQVPYGKGRG